MIKTIEEKIFNFYKKYGVKPIFIYLGSKTFYDLRNEIRYINCLEIIKGRTKFLDMYVFIVDAEEHIGLGV